VKNNPGRGLMVIAASMHGMLQSQSQASSLRQRGDKTQWILVMSTFCKLQNRVTANWGRN